MLYLLERADGGVSIMRTVGAVSIEREITEWQAATQLVCIGFRQITEADVPTDRTLRNAWSYDGTKIEITIERAKNFASQYGLPAAAIASANSVAQVRALVRAEMDRRFMPRARRMIVT